MKKSKINILFCFLFMLFSSNLNSKQKEKITLNFDDYFYSDKIPERESLNHEIDDLPNEFLAFIPINYSVLDTASGDLNQDKIIDYILVLKKDGEDTLSDVLNNPEKRPLLILLRDEYNKLNLVKRNDNTVYCIDCGGMMGDPYMGIEIKNGYFSVEHYGGSGWRWRRIITYKFSKQKNEWFLHKDVSEDFHATDPEKIEYQKKSKKDFGIVKFEEFDIYN